MKRNKFIIFLHSKLWFNMQGFNLHVKHEHNMWNYVHYLMYLEQYGVNNKPIGKYVHDKVNNTGTKKNSITQTMGKILVFSEMWKSM